MKPEEKISFYNDVISMNSEYDNVKGFLLDYKINKELSIYISVLEIKKGIIKFIKNIKYYHINKGDPIIKIQLEKLKEAEIYKKIEDYKIKNYNFIKPNKEELEIYEKIKQENKNYNANKMIEEYKEKITLKSKIESQSFSNYFENFAKFLSYIKKKFDKKFKDIENLENEDFELFKEFCNFIANHNFREISLYINKWNDTFSQTNEYIRSKLEINSNDNINKYKLENNNLILEIYDNFAKNVEIKEINNIDKYSINCIIKHELTKFILYDEGDSF